MLRLLSIVSALLVFANSIAAQYVVEYAFSSFWFGWQRSVTINLAQPQPDGTYKLAAICLSTIDTRVTQTYTPIQCTDPNMTSDVYRWSATNAWAAKIRYDSHTSLLIYHVSYAFRILFLSAIYANFTYSYNGVVLGEVVSEKLVFEQFSHGHRTALNIYEPLVVVA
jgi:hypothetical protein